MFCAHNGSPLVWIVEKDAECALTTTSSQRVHRKEGKDEDREPFYGHFVVNRHVASRKRILFGHLRQRWTLFLLSDTENVTLFRL